MRNDCDVFDVVKLALVGEIVFLPGALDDLETLDLAFLAFGIRYVQRLVGLHDAAAPDAEDQPALGDVVQGRRFLSDAKRVRQRKHLHAGPDLDPLGAGCDRSTEDQRAGGEGARFVEMQSREPHHVQAVLLAGVDDVERGGEAFGLATAGQSRKLVIDTQFHRIGPSPTRSNCRPVLVPVPPGVNRSVRPCVGSMASEKAPNRSSRSLAISSLRCAIITSTSEARTSATSRASRPTAGATHRLGMLPEEWFGGGRSDEHLQRRGIVLALIDGRRRGTALEQAMD